MGGNFWSTNLGDAFQAQPDTVLLSKGTPHTCAPTSSAVGSFAGFTTTMPIASLTLSSTAAVYAGLDNLTIGSAVPEPTRCALVALGLGGLRLARRRQALV